MKIKALRQKNSKKLPTGRRLLYSLLAGLFFCLVIGGFWFVRYQLPRMKFFALKKVEVLGNPQSLSKEAILASAQIPAGAGLFALDLEAIHDRVAQHAFFKQVTVKRQLPGTLLIAVEEYKPLLILSTGRLYYVDEEGDLFYEISVDQTTQDLPIVSGINEDMLLTEPLLVQRILKQAIELKMSYQKTEFFQAYGLSEINFEKKYWIYPLSREGKI